MFHSSEFSGLCGAVKRDIRVIGQRESDKNLIRRGKRRGIGGLDKVMKRDRRIIGPEGRDTFVIFSSFCEVNSRSILLTSFEVGLGSISTLPLGVDRERT